MKRMYGYIAVLTLLMAFNAVAATYVGKQRTIEWDNDGLMKMVETERVNTPEDIGNYYFGMSVEKLLQAAESKGVSPKIIEGTLYIGEEGFRMDTTAPMMGKVSYLVRLDERKMYNVMWDRKQYMELSFEELEQMRQKTQHTMQNMLDNLPPEARAQLEKLPPELRAQMEGQMNPKPEQKSVQVKKTGRVQDINGFRCEEYLVDGGETRRQIWASQKYPELRKTFEAMMTKMPSFDKSEEESDEMQLWKQIPNAWPVVTKEFEFNPRRHRSAGFTVDEITSMEQKGLPKDTFALPAEFTKVTMQDMMGGMMPRQ